MNEEDLQELRELQKNFTIARLRLSDLVVTQKRLESDKVGLIADIENKAAKFSQYQAGLEEKYGKRNVNLETGVLSEA